MFFVKFSLGDRNESFIGVVHLVTQLFIRLPLDMDYIILSLCAVWEIGGKSGTAFGATMFSPVRI